MRFDARSWRQIRCSPACARRAQTANKYGISVASYAELGDSCVLCGKTEYLHIDHDHHTGKVRGMLCISCNTGIGKLGEDPTMLRRAADYLEGAL